MHFFFYNFCFVDTPSLSPLLLSSSPPPQKKTKGGGEGNFFSLSFRRCDSGMFCAIHLIVDTLRSFTLVDETCKMCGISNPHAGSGVVVADAFFFGCVHIRFTRIFQMLTDGIFTRCV